MARIKKIILSSFLIFLIILGLAQTIFANNTGKATKEAKLKKEMDDSSITLEIIPKNDEFEILEEKSEWYRVNYKKIKGYIRKEQVEVIKNNNEEDKNLTNEQKGQNTKDEETIQNTVDIEQGVQQEAAQVETQELQIGTKVYTKSELQIFLRPLPSSMKIQTLEKGKELTVVDIANHWVYISLGNKMGWVKKDLLETKKPEPIQKPVEQQPKDEPKPEEKYLNKTAYITSDGINFRQSPDTDSKVLKTFLQNAKVTILLEEGKWYKIKHNDQEGYVLKTYVSEKKVEAVTSRSSSTREISQTANVITSEETKQEQANKTTQSKASQIVDMAKKYLGSRYVYGGASPSGFDCSGFTMYLYKQFGISLPHSATAQSKKGTKVEKANLQPGDLVFFTNYRTKKGIGHCGIYIGNNQFIHASTEKTGVITSSLNAGSYRTRYVTAVRVF